jgi:hypothetical protein
MLLASHSDYAVRPRDRRSTESLTEQGSFSLTACDASILRLEVKYEIKITITPESDPSQGR